MDYKTAKKYTNFLEKQKNGIPQYFKQNPVSIFAQKSQIQAPFFIFSEKRGRRFYVRRLGCDYSERRAVTGSERAAFFAGIRPPIRVSTTLRATRMAAEVGGR